MLDTVLIVDGDSEQKYKTEYLIHEKLKYRTITAAREEDAVNIVLSSNSIADIMLLDMRAKHDECLKIIRSIKLRRPDFPIIIFTEYGDHNYAAQAIQAGANDFLVKPASIERLGLSLANALRICHLCRTIERLEKNLALNQVSPLRLASLSPYNNEGNIRELRALEEDAIRFALNICGGSMSKAARSLGIGRSTLYRKVNDINRNRKSQNYISRENQTTRPAIFISGIKHS